MESWLLILIISTNVARAKLSLMDINDDRLYYQVIAFNERERFLLYTLYSTTDMFVFLNGVTNHAGLPMHVIIRKGNKHLFERYLEANGIQFTFIKNTLSLGALSDSHSKDVASTFYDWEDFEREITVITKQYPNLLEKNVIGKTFETRDIIVLKISKKTNASKCSVFILGGEQGRDRLSAGITFNIIKQILQNINYMHRIMDYYDFYICPLLNPDGYEFSFKVTVSQQWEECGQHPWWSMPYWSRNRKILTGKLCSSNKTAVGINIDRNWFFESSLDDVGDCRGINMGRKPLQEKETQSLSQFLNSIAPRLVLFINVKGFGNTITVPYAYTKEYSNNYPLAIEILTAAHAVLHEKFNVTYDLGNAARMIYNYTGSCSDWVKRELNVPLVYTVYMKCNDEVLPSKDDIEPLGSQLFVLVEQILSLAKVIYDPIFNHSNIIYICKANTIAMIVISIIIIN